MIVEKTLQGNAYVYDVPEGIGYAVTKPPQGVELAENEAWVEILDEQSFTISSDETTVNDPVIVKIEPAWKTEKLFINGERKETIDPENGVAEAEIVFEEAGLYEIHWNGENRYVEVV